MGDRAPWTLCRVAFRRAVDALTARLRRRNADEASAERFLRGQGLELVARNFSRPHGEIDLVMLDGGDLVFVEVRFRGPGAWYTGSESVDLAKQRRLARTAASFLLARPEHAMRHARFDVVSITKTNYGHRSIDWISDAFQDPAIC